MLPKNPAKNKHCSKCITHTDEKADDISNVLPPDQFFTMLKEHQSSILTLETKLKSMNAQKGMHRPLAEEIDYLKSEIDKKQNIDNEIFLRNELNKQDKEIKKLKEELKTVSEQNIKSRLVNPSYENNKEVFDMKDQIVALSNLVKYSLNNVDDRLHKMEDFN